MMNSLKTLTGLAGAVSLSALVGLPAVAQVNNNPSIFNEAPYNRINVDPVAPESSLNTNPSIFNEAPYNRSTSDQVSPNSSADNACMTESSAMSSSTTMMNGDAVSSSTSNSYDNSALNQSTVGSSSYLGPDTTGTQNRAIYGISPSSNNVNNLEGTSNFTRSNLAGGSYDQSMARLNTIHPTDGPAGGFVIRRFNEMRGDYSNSPNTVAQASTYQQSTSSNPSIYRVTPSNVNPDNAMSSMESSSSYSSSTVCRP